MISSPHLDLLLTGQLFIGTSSTLRWSRTYSFHLNVYVLHWTDYSLEMP